MCGWLLLSFNGRQVWEAFVLVAEIVVFVKEVVEVVEMVVHGCTWP